MNIAEIAIKNRVVTIGTPGPEDLEPHAVTGDDGMMVTEWAPYGVIGSISPTTNPTSTIINNAIAMISAGNAVVFNVHPSAKRVSVENIKLLKRSGVEVIIAPAVTSGNMMATATSQPNVVHLLEDVMTAKEGMRM